MTIAYALAVEANQSAATASGTVTVSIYVDSSNRATTHASIARRPTPTAPTGAPPPASRRPPVPAAAGTSTYAGQ
jgi:hypothetical protein